MLDALDEQAVEDHVRDLAARAGRAVAEVTTFDARLLAALGLPPTLG